MAEHLLTPGQVAWVIQNAAVSIEDPTIRTKFLDGIGIMEDEFYYPSQVAQAIKRRAMVLGIWKDDQEETPQLHKAHRENTQVTHSSEYDYPAENIYAEMLVKTREEDNVTFVTEGPVSRNTSSGKVMERTQWKLTKGAGGAYYYSFFGEAAFPSGATVNELTVENIATPIARQFERIIRSGPDQNGLIFARAGWAVAVSTDSRPVRVASGRRIEEHYLLFKGLPDTQALRMATSRSLYREGAGFLLLPENQGGRENIAKGLHAYKVSTRIITSQLDTLLPRR